MCYLGGGGVSNMYVVPVGWVMRSAASVAAVRLSSVPPAASSAAPVAPSSDAASQPEIIHSHR